MSKNRSLRVCLDISWPPPWWWRYSLFVTMKAWVVKHEQSCCERSMPDNEGFYWRFLLNNGLMIQILPVISTQHDQNYFEHTSENSWASERRKIFEPRARTRWLPVVTTGGHRWPEIVFISIEKSTLCWTVLDDMLLLFHVMCEHYWNITTLCHQGWYFSRIKLIKSTPVEKIG